MKNQLWITCNRSTYEDNLGNVNLIYFIEGGPDNKVWISTVGLNNNSYCLKCNLGLVYQ